MADKSNEDFFAFSLVTLDDLLSCYAYANSVQSHSRTLIRNKKLILQHGLNENEFKWSVAEWEYACLSRLEFDNVYDLSEGYLKTLKNDEDYKHYQRSFYDVMIEVLEDLNQEGLFDKSKEKNNVTLFVTALDSYWAEELEEKSSRILNSKDVHESFMNSMIR